MKEIIVIGLFFDIMGAFLLGVEAIRLPNIKKFKEQILAPLHSHSMSPRLFFKGDSNHNREVSKLEPRKSETWPPGLFQGLHWIAGFLVIVLLYFLSHGAILTWFIIFLNWGLGLKWYFSLFFIIFLVWSVFLIWYLGELVHIAIEKSLSFLVNVADFILSRTQEGKTGLYGLCFLMFGFSLQAIGVILT